MEQKFRTAGDFAPDQFQESASIWLRCCEFAIDFPSEKCRAIVNRYRLSYSFEGHIFQSFDYLFDGIYISGI